MKQKTANNTVPSTPMTATAVQPAAPNNNPRADQNQQIASVQVTNNHFFFLFNDYKEIIADPESGTFRWTSIEDGEIALGGRIGRRECGCGLSATVAPSTTLPGHCDSTQLQQLHHPTSSFCST